MAWAVAAPQPRSRQGAGGYRESDSAMNYVSVSGR